MYKYDDNSINFSELNQEWNDLTLISNDPKISPKKTNEDKANKIVSNQFNCLNSDINLSSPDNFEINGVEYVLKPPYNYTSVLKEYCDFSRDKMEESSNLETIGNMFELTIKINNKEFGKGIGQNKTAARKEASKRAIIRLFGDKSKENFFSKYIEVFRKRNILESSPPSLKSLASQVKTENTISGKSDGLASHLQNNSNFNEEDFMEKPLEKVKIFKINEGIEKESKSSYKDNNFKKYEEQRIKPSTSIEKTEMNEEEKVIFQSKLFSFYRNSIQKDFEKCEIDEQITKLINNLKSCQPIQDVIPVGSFLTMISSNEVDFFVVYQKAKGLSLDKLIYDVKSCTEKNLNNFIGKIVCSETNGEKYIIFSVKNMGIIFQCFFRNSEVDLSMDSSLKINELYISAKNKYSKEKFEVISVLRGILKNIKPFKFQILTGEDIDIIIYVITKAFSKIDLITNIRNFIEFIALGALSSSSSWLWDDIPEKTLFTERFIISGISYDQLEERCLAIVKNGDLNFLLG